jgi:hypothetical protein
MICYNILGKLSQMYLEKLKIIKDINEKYQTVEIYQHIFEQENKEYYRNSLIFSEKTVNACGGEQIFLKNSMRYFKD